MTRKQPKTRFVGIRMSLAEQLIQEAGVPPNPDLIAEAVNVIVSIRRTATGRRVEEVAAVRGWTAGGGFHIAQLA